MRTDSHVLVEASAVHLQPAAAEELAGLLVGHAEVELPLVGIGEVNLLAVDESVLVAASVPAEPAAEPLHGPEVKEARDGCRQLR